MCFLCVLPSTTLSLLHVSRLSLSCCWWIGFHHMQGVLQWDFSMPGKRVLQLCPETLSCYLGSFFSKVFFMSGKGQGLLCRRVSLNCIFIKNFFFQRQFKWKKKSFQNQDEMRCSEVTATSCFSFFLVPLFHKMSYYCICVVTLVCFFWNLLWCFSKYLHNSWESSSTEHVLNWFAQL